MKYNKGEWSEAYAFVKLIANSCVFASDENLNKIPDKYYPILKVFKDEIEKYYETNITNDLINIVDYEGNVISSLKKSEFLKIADKSLAIIKNTKGRSFEVPIMENFLNKIGIDNFKASTRQKDDLKLEIFDKNINKSDKLTFSIKSELGGKPTILNASKATNFTFQIKGISDEDFNYLNGINKENTKHWLKTKFHEIFKKFEIGKYEICWVDEENNILYQNLRLIDSNLPKIVAFILFYYHCNEKSSNIPFLTEKLIEYNPLKLNDVEKTIFYKKKVSEFIESVTFGMMPHVEWDGNYVISGGLLTIKKDGEIVCHHIFYDDKALKNYLFKNTKLEAASTSRHEYGQLYKENGEVFFKLNLQLRFK